MALCVPVGRAEPSLTLAGEVGQMQLRLTVLPLTPLRTRCGLLRLRSGLGCFTTRQRRRTPQRIKGCDLPSLLLSQQRLQDLAELISVHGHLG